MNIFVLSENPREAARFHCDKHVVKMILEYGQLLSTAKRLWEGQVCIASLDPAGPFKRFHLLGMEHVAAEEVIVNEVPKLKLRIQNPVCYNVAHVNHPSNVWARETSANYEWLFELFMGVLDEYTRRYGKEHSAEKLVDILSRTPRNIPEGQLTPFAQAMPEEYKDESPVAAYRSYYVGSKARFARWTNTPVPDWFINRMEGQDVSLFSRTRAVD